MTREGGNSSNAREIESCSHQRKKRIIDKYLEKKKLTNEDGLESGRDKGGLESELREFKWCVVASWLALQSSGYEAVPRAEERGWEVAGRVSRLIFAAACDAHDEERLKDFEVHGGLLLEDRFESEWTHKSAVLVHADNIVSIGGADRAFDGEFSNERREARIASSQVSGRTWYQFERERER